MVTLIGAISFVKQNPTQKDIEAAVSFSGGSGTQDDPYLISNKEDFAEFAKNINSDNPYSGQFFEVTQDIVGMVVRLSK